jgi:hypothetical protein
MSGIVTFTSLAAALKAGYQIYDRTQTGYIVRVMTSAGWALALVTCKNESSRTEA